MFDVKRLAYCSIHEMKGHHKCDLCPGEKVNKLPCFVCVNEIMFDVKRFSLLLHPQNERTLQVQSLSRRKGK
jgi:hypothetical protein